MRGEVRVAFALLLSGCSSVLGIEDLQPISVVKGKLFDLADPDRGVADATITLHTGSEVEVDKTTTKAGGRFELALPTNIPFDGYFEIVDPRYVHTFSYLILPIPEEGTDQDIITLTTDTLQALATRAHTTQNESNWLVLAKVVRADGEALSGATVSSEPVAPPDKMCYSDEDGQPCAAGSTAVDGFAWFFDAPEENTLTIKAMDAQGQPHSSVPVSLGVGPGVVFTAVRPSP